MLAAANAQAYRKLVLGKMGLDVSQSTIMTRQNLTERISNNYPIEYFWQHCNLRLPNY